MSISIDKRKRCREGDLLCDSMPLSKRINNLHLSGSEKTRLQRYQNMMEQPEQSDPVVNNPYQQQVAHVQHQTSQHINNNHLPQDYILKGIVPNTVQCHATEDSSSLSASCSTSSATSCHSTTSIDTSICNTPTTSTTSVLLDGANLGIDMNLEVAESNIYNPELSENENPFYYTKNKLLHELHMERSRRCHMASPSNSNAFHL